MFTRVWRDIGINYPEKIGISVDQKAALHNLGDFWYTTVV